ncbi:hypothetical protein ABIF96_005457 [Bradyrhizobium ottawaense]|uniref:hypothetical protein n=1 Tax=Bradyrhizobium ottawaense TaxID=931866 RepID=UPI003839327A
MSTLKLLSTGLIAVAMLGGPVMARERHAVVRPSSMEANPARIERIPLSGWSRLRSGAACWRICDGAVDRRQRPV